MLLALVTLKSSLPWSNAFWPGLTPFGPPMWQAEADTEMTLSASPTTAVGQKALALAKRRYSTVECSQVTVKFTPLQGDKSSS